MSPEVFQIYTPRKRSLGQGNVFTPVCLLRGEGLPMRGCLHPRGGGLHQGGVGCLQWSASKGVCIQGGLQPGGSVTRGGGLKVCIQGEGVCIQGEGVCIQGEGPASRGRGSASRGVCLRGDGCLHPGGWANPLPEPQKRVVRILLECFIVFGNNIGRGVWLSNGSNLID